MPARFAVRGSFAIPSRKLFVVHGDIADGIVKAGMKMLIRINTDVLLSLRVDEVNFLDGRDRHELGLCSVCKSEEEIEMLCALSVGGETIEVSES